MFITLSLRVCRVLVSTWPESVTLSPSNIKPKSFKVDPPLMRSTVVLISD